MEYRPARTPTEFKDLMNSDAKLIRTMDDWLSFCRDASTSAEHPLYNLSLLDVDKFTEGLVFNGLGIAGLDVGSIQELLPYSRYKKLLAKFGMDIVYAADHEGYACIGRGTCAKTVSHICTSNC